MRVLFGVLGQAGQLCAHSRDAGLRVRLDAALVVSPTTSIKRRRIQFVQVRGRRPQGVVASLHVLLLGGAFSIEFITRCPNKRWWCFPPCSTPLFTSLRRPTWPQGRSGDAWRGLGSVLLAVTGSEALYADMGHFSANAIRVSECEWGWMWFL